MPEHNGEDEEENEDEGFGVAETYADYMPAKRKYFKSVVNYSNIFNDYNL